MKRRWLKSVRNVGLIIVLTIGLCACGGRENDNREDANADMAAENVYRVVAHEISPWADCEDCYINVQSASCKNDGVCAVMALRDRLENKVYYAVLTADGALSDLQITPLELPEDVQESLADGQNDVIGEEEPDENIRVYENTGYDNFSVAADKRIYGLRRYTYSYDNASTGEHREEKQVQVCCWDTNGQLLWQSEIEDLYGDNTDAETVNVQGAYAAGDGSLNLLLSGENAYKIHISQEGELSGRKKLSVELAALLSDCFGIWAGEDDSLRIMYPDEEDGEKTWLVDYNIDTDTMGEPWELPFTFAWGVFERISAGSVSDLIYTKTDGIFVYNKGDEQGTLKMNYVNSDINITGVDTLLEMDESRFFAFFRENNDGILKVGVFSYVKPEDITAKKVIVLGGTYIDEIMRKQVVAFNQKSDTYKIVLKEYTYDEYSGSYLQLNNDIIAGNMPDILLAAGLPVENYIEKGLIADLYPLIEQDEELSREEFMDNVFEAYSVEGRLMYVVPGFMVSTMAAKTSLAGDGSDWSIEKARQVFTGMADGTQFISGMTRDMFMDTVITFCGRDFIDVETGKCTFDSEEFIDLMEFAAVLPEEIDRDSLYEGDYWEGYEAQYRDNMTLLMELHIDCLNSSLSYQLNGYIGEDYTFVGFPTDSIGSGAAYIYSDDLMVLSAESDNPEGAWEFVRYYLTDEYQESLDWGLPVNRRILTEKAQKLTEPLFYTDENGVKVEYEDTLYYHGEDVPVPPMTRAQLEKMIAHLESVKTTAFVNDAVCDIIIEETKAFFAGDKTAEEAAGIIQSRVQLYMKENQ